MSNNNSSDINVDLDNINDVVLDSFDQLSVKSSSDLFSPIRRSYSVHTSSSRQEQSNISNNNDISNFRRGIPERRSANISRRNTFNNSNDTIVVHKRSSNDYNQVIPFSSNRDLNSPYLSVNNIEDNNNVNPLVVYSPSQFLYSDASSDSETDDLNFGFFSGLKNNDLSGNIQDNSQCKVKNRVNMPQDIKIIESLVSNKNDDFFINKLDYRNDINMNRSKSNLSLGLDINNINKNKIDDDATSPIENAQVHFPKVKDLTHNIVLADTSRQDYNKALLRPIKSSFSFIHSRNNVPNVVLERSKNNISPIYMNNVVVPLNDRGLHILNKDIALSQSFSSSFDSVKYSPNNSYLKDSDDDLDDIASEKDNEESDDIPHTSKPKDRKNAEREYMKSKPRHYNSGHTSYNSYSVGGGFIDTPTRPETLVVAGNSSLLYLEEYDSRTPNVGGVFSTNNSESSLNDGNKTNEVSLSSSSVYIPQESSYKVNPNIIRDIIEQSRESITSRLLQDDIGFNSDFIDDESKATIFGEKQSTSNALENIPSPLGSVNMDEFDSGVDSDSKLDNLKSSHSRRSSDIRKSHISSAVSNNLNLKNRFSTTSVLSTNNNENKTTEMCNFDSSIADIERTLKETDKLHPEFVKSYDLMKYLGCGTTAFVMLGRRIVDNRPVAVKFIYKDRIAVDCWTRDRQIGMVPREVFVLKRLNHPNIIEFFDCFEDSDFVYVVMEAYGINKALLKDIGIDSNLIIPSFLTNNPKPMQSFDLYEYIESSPYLDEDTIKNIFKQITSAVVYMHKLGFVHRDIKDENILLDYSFHVDELEKDKAIIVKLGDFGSSSRIPFDKLDYFTKAQGTVQYFAPEVLQQNPHSGVEQDIWSLGVLLFVLSYAQTPFADTDSIIASELPEPRFKRTELLMDLITKMLTKDVSSRIKSENVLSHPFLAS